MAGIGVVKALAIIVLGTMVSGRIAAESAASGSNSGQMGQNAPEAAEPASFDETTGAISGLVVNDEGLPIAGALAGIRETAAQTIADVGGTFTFSNLVPGDYSIDVSQLGYESVSKRVSVAAGEVTHANLALATIAVESAWHETIVENGNIMCSVRAYPGAPTTGAAGAPPWTTGVAACAVVTVPGNPLSADRFLIRYEIPETVVEMLVEMTWQSTQATGSALSFVVEHGCCANSMANTFGRDEGRSPLAIYANKTTMEAIAVSSEKDCFAEGCELMTRVFAEAETTGLGTPVPLGPFPAPLGDPKDRLDFGITFDQRFTQYFTHFHLDVMPEGYSALADA